MVCGNFILPEPASYVFFYAVFNLRKLLYIIAKHGKCANKNLPKSEYGSLLKGCRRLTNWNLFGIFDYPLIKKLHLFIRMKPMLSIFHNRKC